MGYGVRCVTDRNLYRLRNRILTWNCRDPFPLPDHLKAVLAVKGSLRRPCWCALDCSGPLWSFFLEGENTAIRAGRDCDMGGGRDRGPLFGCSRQMTPMLIGHDYRPRQS